MLIIYFQTIWYTKIGFKVSIQPSNEDMLCRYFRLRWIPNSTKLFLKCDIKQHRRYVGIIFMNKTCERRYTAWFIGFKGLDGIILMCHEYLFFKEFIKFWYFWQFWADFAWFLWFSLFLMWFYCNFEEY